MDIVRWWVGFFLVDGVAGHFLRVGGGGEDIYFGWVGVGGHFLCAGRGGWGYILGEWGLLTFLWVGGGSMGVC